VLARSTYAPQRRLKARPGDAHENPRRVATSRRRIVNESPEQKKKCLGGGGALCPRSAERPVPAPPGSAREALRCRALVSPSRRTRRQPKKGGLEPLISNRFQLVGRRPFGVATTAGSRPACGIRIDRGCERSRHGLEEVAGRCTSSVPGRAAAGARRVLSLCPCPLW